MKINGNPVTSGTIVIGPGEQGEISLPIGNLPVEFRTDGGPTRIDFVAGSMVLFNMSSSIGAAGTPLLATGSTHVPIRVVLYSVGTLPDAYHVLHYTYG